MSNTKLIDPLQHASTKASLELSRNLGMLSGTTVIIVIQLYWIMFNTKPQRVVIGAIKGTSSARLHDELAWEPLSIRRERHKLCQF